MNDKTVTINANANTDGDLSYMGLDDHISKVLKQIADGISDSGVGQTGKVLVQFNLVVNSQACYFETYITPTAKT